MPGSRQEDTGQARRCCMLLAGGAPGPRLWREDSEGEESDVGSGVLGRPKLKHCCPTWLNDLGEPLISLMVSFPICEMGLT